MSLSLNLKPTHKPIKQYYAELGEQRQMRLFSEGNVAPAFASLLRHCAGQTGHTLAEQYTYRTGDKNIRFDGALLTPFKLIYGVWEAKDSDDKLEKEIEKKFKAGYPRDNILFQAPDYAILVQDGEQVFNAPITDPTKLVDVLSLFFQYQPPKYEQWEQAVSEFKDRVPQLAAGLLELIEKEYTRNVGFIRAFDNFYELCRRAINPNLSRQAVEEMLIQHLLTERIFRRVFNNPEFAQRNIIAREIETVIQALTSQHFSRDAFLRDLDRFYGAIELTAGTIRDYSEKQGFLNTVYEQFFQGFSIKTADTHGIVYTPQSIVDFMVRSVEDILQREFGRSMTDEGVHILDPFVGTGNFILRVLREIASKSKSRLPHKFAHELHCNEVMLLPYYIASMNIEHEFLELTGQYAPFEGICLVDTFELAEARQLPMFTEANTECVAHQKKQGIFVIIGNPPYNAWQVNENDNNKNRRYAVLDKRLNETYVKASSATLRNSLYDPYVKAIRWASDRIGQEGVVAFVTNNSFIDNIAFDGMRKHLGQEFDAVYVLDLGGNVRKNSKGSALSNVFDIRVGVSISFLVKGGKTTNGIYYFNVPETGKKQDKLDVLDKTSTNYDIQWQIITPNTKHTWLTTGMQDDWASFLPMGTKEAKRGAGEAIFDLFSNGVKTNRDIWVYDFQKSNLIQKTQRTIEVFNDYAFRWSRIATKPDLDDFVTSDETKISWSSTLKPQVKRGVFIDHQISNIRISVYRPFTKMYLYFDDNLIDRPGQFQRIFPTPETEQENRIIFATDIGSEKPFMTFMTDCIADLHVVGAGSSAQCFPFYIYDADGSNRRENISDWGLKQFQDHYGDSNITKWDIFYYIYALLHHPEYRTKYAANLRRELPRVPFVPPLTPPSIGGNETPLPEFGEGQGVGSNILQHGQGVGFFAFADAGRKLAELHVHYEQQPEYRLQRIENAAAPLDWRVEKMRWNRDKTAIIYNDFLTLGGIPAEAHAYKLGSRSALDWLIEEYRVTTDKRSGITNDPNRLDEPEYIVRLIGKVTQVSVETMKIIASLPPLA